MNVYYRPPDGGRLVSSVDAFLRSYFVTLKESYNNAYVQVASFKSFLYVFTYENRELN